jgi:eukaryotic-like serine/threonine-protein kinase
MPVSSKAGRYELQQELGRGSMGVVYRAVDPVIGRTVAVKTVQLTAEVAGMSHSELLARFQTEARAAGLLAHPNIVVVYDAGEDDGLFYITMELVEGGSLQEQMNLRQPIPLPRVMRWMQQSCSALEFAHQHSVIHRDIKPANLMLMADDTLKVTDFGTAKILQLNITQTAHVIGTPSYMSPEQVKGKPVDGRTDVFSLGVVLYELLTGAKPFAGESVTTVIYKVVNEDPIPPRELDSTIHPGLSAVVQRALSKSPWARFQSCREFAQALEHYQDFDEPRPARVAPTLPTAQYVPEIALMEPERGRSRGAVWVALLSLVIIGGAGYRVWPALQEIWQRHETANVAIAPADTTSSTNIASPATPATAGPALAPALATPDGGTAASVASAAAAATDPTVPAAAVATPASATMGAPGIAPIAAQPEPSQPTVKPVVVRKPTAPQVSQQAAEWKDLIEAKLSESNIGSEVRVVATGNTVTLTGKLGPIAHRRLLSKLQFVPASLQIIDDIEYTEEPLQTPQDSATSNKQ